MDCLGDFVRNLREIWSVGSERTQGNFGDTQSQDKSRIEDLHDDSGIVAYNDANKAILLNSFFSSVFTREDIETVPAPPQTAQGPKLDTINITEETVKDKLVKLTASSSPGPDGIHPRILKQSAGSVCVALTKIFNTSLRRRSLHQSIGSEALWYLYLIK